MPAELLRFPSPALKVKVTGFKAPSIRNRQKDMLPYSPEWSVKAAMDMIDLLNGRIEATVVVRDTQRDYRAVKTLHRATVLIVSACFFVTYRIRAAFLLGVQAREPELKVLLYNEDGGLVHLPLVSSGLAELE